MVANELVCQGYPVEILDGDEIRQHLTKDLGYSKADRNENIRRIGYVAKLLSRNGVVAIVAAISPYRALRDEIRQEIERFVEVYVKCDVEACTARDVKGMYKRALKGELLNFTGVSDPYEPPLNADLTVETDRETAHESASKILSELSALKYIDRKAEQLDDGNPRDITNPKKQNITGQKEQ